MCIVLLKITNKCLITLIYSAETNIAFQSCDTYALVKYNRLCDFLYIYTENIILVFPTMVVTLVQLLSKRTMMVLYCFHELTELHTSY